MLLHSKSATKGHGWESQWMDEHNKLGPITSLTVNFNCFQVRHLPCVLYDQYMWYKIIKLYSHTQLSVYYKY